MDPHTLPSPGFEAPPQHTEANREFTVGEAPQADEHHNIELPSVMPAGPAQQGVITPTAGSVPDDPLAMPFPGSTSTTNDAPLVNTDNLHADDGDVIEKAWILKAKTVVEQTRDDPYRQNKEISRIKADYIKKRYNKDIKISEG